VGNLAARFLICFIKNIDEQPLNIHERVRDIEVGIKPPGAPPNSPQSDH